MKRLAILGLMVVLVMGLTTYAGAVTFTATSGELAASADFSIVGGNLQVILTNTSTADVGVPAEVLTALFFDLNGVGALTPLSALLSGGSTVFYDPDGQPAGGNVGGEWAYASGLSGAPGGATEGISSSGLNLFGPLDRFPGADLAPPLSPDGLQYGLLSAGDLVGTGNTGITGSGGLIKNQVTFLLSGLPVGMMSLDISNVSFQYGTALTEPNIRVPEPSTLMLLGFGLAGVGLYRRMRK